jgi:uncharacterized phage protein (TIGR01671 family)
MRETKFRGWVQLNSKKGGWVYGDLDHDSKGEITYIHHGSFFDIVDPASVGQFTDLHDKNGKEIYEEDLVRVGHLRLMIYWCTQYEFNDAPPKDKQPQWAWRVCFNESTGKCIPSKNHPPIYYGFNSKEMEIIGNIYENPELLKR